MCLDMVFILIVGRILMEMTVLDTCNFLLGDRVFRDRVIGLVILPRAIINNVSRKKYFLKQIIYRSKVFAAASRG